MTQKEILFKEVEELPENLVEEILHYIQFLKSKVAQGGDKSETTEPFSFSWEGELKELKEQYTSVELQHKAKEWR